MKHNFGIYLSVNFMCGIRPPCRTAVCYQPMCHIVGELGKKKGKRKVQGVLQSQTAALPRPQEEEETDKSKQAQIEQTYEKQ